MMKLHLAHRFVWLWYGKNTTPHVAMFCGFEAFGLSADFTTDIATMECLPDAKVCQSCLNAHRARRKEQG
jgi:hypothetical protein